MTPPPKSPIVCDCLQVTEAQIVRAIRDHAPRTLRELTACSSAGEGCNSCHPLLRGYLEKLRGQGTTWPPRSRRAAPTDSSPALPL